MQTRRAFWELFPSIQQAGRFQIVRAMENIFSPQMDCFIDIVLCVFQSLHQGKVEKSEGFSEFF